MAPAQTAACRGTVRPNVAADGVEGNFAIAQCHLGERELPSPSQTPSTYGSIGSSVGGYCEGLAPGESRSSEWPRCCAQPARHSLRREHKGRWRTSRARPGSKRTIGGRRRRRSALRLRKRLRSTRASRWTGVANVTCARPTRARRRPVADLELTHRRPAIRCRDRRIQGQRLADRCAGGEDDQVGALEAAQEFVQVHVAGGDAVAGGFAVGGPRSAPCTR